MKYRVVVLGCLAPAFAALSQPAEQSRPLLESEEFAEAKINYRNCVLEKGVQLMSVTSIRRYATAR